MTLKSRLLIDYYLGGLAHLAFKPLTILLGYLLKRNHRLDNVSDVVILKLLGGGSLMIAYPALLAIKQRAGVKTLRLVASPSTKPFGELLGIFDEIILIRDEGLFTIACDAMEAIRRLWRCDAIVDLEVHSRLSTIFCLLTGATNRIGFYTQESFWRRNLETHLLFFHVDSPVFYFYEQVARILGATGVPFAEACARFRGSITSNSTAKDGESHLAIAPCCSGLGRERMLQHSEWCSILERRLQRGELPTHIDLLAAPSDRDELDALRQELLLIAPQIAIINHAGLTSLKQSVDLLLMARELFTIDSSLLHIASLLQIPCTSFWGPTAPQTRLQLLDQSKHTLHYRKLPCSPCVHLTATPPCHGNNLCMRLAVNPDLPIDPNPPWLAQV